MDLTDLECVVAAADLGGFTAAATALSISQPSLSKRIAGLERELGTPLFHRVGRGVVLTRAGDALLVPARESLSQAAAARASVAAVTGLAAGELHIVALPTILVTLVVPVVNALRRAHPGLVLRLSGAEDSDAVAAAVAGARVDVGVCDLPVRPLGLEAIHLFHQELVAVLPPGSDARGGRCELAELVDYPLVTTPRGTSTRRLVEDLYAAAGRPAPVAVETEQRDALVPLVLGGAGLTFVSEPLAAQAASFGGVVIHLDPSPVRPVGLIVRQGHRAPAVLTFIDEASSRFGTLAPTDPTDPGR